MIRRRRPLVIAIVVLALVVALAPAALGQSPPAYAEPAVDAKIQIVWPHDEQGKAAPVETAPLVNVEVYLFEGGTLNPVPQSFSNRVVLRWAANSLSLPRPAEDARVGEKTIVERDGHVFPAWVFNDVPVGSDHWPPSADLRTYYWVEVEGVDYRTNVWCHAADARTVAPHPWIPDDVESAPSSVDAMVQIVWPHDESGQEQPVAQAELVNVGVDLFAHPLVPEPISSGHRVKTVDFDFSQPVRLLRALNDGFLEPVGQGERVSHTTPRRNPSYRIFDYPRWVLNDVDVSAARDPVNKYYFAVKVDGIETHTTIWAHGADARTYFPTRDVPARSADGRG